MYFENKFQDQGQAKDIYLNSQLCKKVKFWAKMQMLFILYWDVLNKYYVNRVSAWESQYFLL